MSSFEAGGVQDQRYEGHALAALRLETCNNHIIIIFQNSSFDLDLIVYNLETCSTVILRRYKIWGVTPQNKCSRVSFDVDHRRIRGLLGCLMVV